MRPTGEALAWIMKHASIMLAWIVAASSLARADRGIDLDRPVRYLGGGATNTDPNNYAKNWLHFIFIGVGADYDLVASGS